MQRIDENTYIDDTLVTCAEYQLFIDEMREQGKYYQPDHWTSYQFPKGQAKEPILGVRHSDAVSFCKWLSEHEGKEWKFRLPAQKEANAFSVKPVERSPLGYWVGGNDRFAWVGAVPGNPRNLDLSLARASDLKINFIPDLALARDLDSARARDLDSARARALDLDSALDRASDRASTRVRNLDRYRLGSAHDLVLTRSHDLNSALYFARHRALDHDLASAIDLALDFGLARASDIFIDFFTLQERIAGRSPAFEGIRLVKERTR